MERAGDILNALFDRKQHEEGQRYVALYKRWEQMAGEQIAAHSHIQDLRNGVVVVEVEHPGWIQLIQLRQQHILGALQAAFPELVIRGLRLQLPRQDEPAPREEVAAAKLQDETDPRTDTSEMSRDAGSGTSYDSALEKIRDKTLRSLLESLGERIRQNNPE